MEKTIEVDATVHAVYNQWTQFEETGAWRGETRKGNQVS